MAEKGAWCKFCILVVSGKSKFWFTALLRRFEREIALLSVKKELSSKISPETLLLGHLEKGSNFDNFASEPNFANLPWS